MSTASAFGSGPARWSLRLFGGFELGSLSSGERITSLGKRERVLLAFLALSPNCRQPRRKLATLLWGDATDETLLDNLRQCLWGLRKTLGDAEHRVIASEAEDVVLDVAAFEVDALAFRRLAAQSGRAGLEAAANLCSGELLDGLDIENEEFESWRRAEVTSYRDQAANVLYRLMTLLSEQGETVRAIETGLRILQRDPLHEAAIRRMMRLYADSGRRGAAAQLYRSLADSLRSELNAQPEAETRLLFAEIARGGEAQTGVAIPAGSKPQPVPVSTERPGDPASPPTPQSNAPSGASERRKRINPAWILSGGLAAAIVALLLLQQFALPSFTAQRQTGVEAAKAASSSVNSAISIAVLPFANLSGDANQEFFSDGMTEEIITTLAKVPDLRVVARESASQYKGEKIDLRAVGKALGATHLLEGSVRRDGNRVRVTAQLVEAENGLHVWANSYDRELTGVFVIQEDIATAIAGALRMPLGLKPGEHLISSRDIDPDSYERFLRARALIQGRGLKPLTDATALLEQVVGRHPDFAPAWAQLAVAYDLTPNARPERNGTAAEYRRVVDEFLPKAEAAAERAVQTDPSAPDGYAALASHQYQRGNPLQAEEYRAKALALDPTGSTFLHGRSEQIAALGHPKEALVLRRQLQALEPFVPVFNDVTAAILWVNGQNDEALAIAKTMPPNRLGRLAMMYASMGRYREAADTLAQYSGGVNSPELVAEAVRLLRSAPAKVDAPEKLPELGSLLSWVYLYVGAPDRVLPSYEAIVEGGRLPGQEMDWLWHPSYAPVRKTERFKAFVRKTGFVDYWRAKGWPDLCHPVGADDFVCE